MISYFKYKNGISQSDKWPVFKGHTLQFIQQIAAKMYMAKLDAGWFISNLLIEKQKIIKKKCNYYSLPSDEVLKTSCSE